MFLWSTATFNAILRVAAFFDARWDVADLLTLAIMLCILCRHTVCSRLHRRHRKK